MPTVTFHDALGRILARGSLPADALEGAIGTIKDIDVNFHVIAGGKLDHYIVVSPDGTAVKGSVIEKRGNHLRDLYLDSLDVAEGGRLEGKWQVEIIPD